ncbi:MAG TPA: allophanate hydrolase [Polyangia bacterium]|nr:allophanate hydrolase [Polyangia bacterium]
MRTTDSTTERSLDLHALSRSGASPTDTIEEALARIARRGDDGVWISLAPRERLLAAARALEDRRRAGEHLPLYGVPFAVKDNIDVAGLPTTAACPAFSYTPTEDAAAVARLAAAGALAVGKTNMDQFATGLVGVRSPYGVPRNPFDADMIPGGSSSGSAVAVAAGLVTFALGTDTAGSGRVPAAFNNIVGVKPSPGLISARGVVPACRSLDCVSIFGLTTSDAATVAEVARGFDGADPYSREEADEVCVGIGATPSRFRFGVPDGAHLDFCGDARSERAFAAALDRLRALGGEPVAIDFAPFSQTAALLYEGPFVAERLEAAGTLLEREPGALLPPIRAILEGARRHDGAAVFAALHARRALRRRALRSLAGLDCLVVPTAPTIYGVAAVEADPIRLNATLGAYVNFVNLLGLAAVAAPAGFRADGLPFGVTFVGRWGEDGRLAGFADRFERSTSERLGATAARHPDVAPIVAAPTAWPRLAVVGAHLSGEPLNHQLTGAGGVLVRACRTAPRYRLFALANTTPAKPGMVRSSEGVGGGVALEVEVWALPPAAFGQFVARVPAPLCIGSVELEDGGRVSGFLCEPHAVVGARDISSFGGWRAFKQTTA